MTKVIMFFLAAVPLLLLAAGCGKKTSDGGKVWIERWRQERPMTQKRAGVGVISVGKRIYAIGGGEFNGNRLKIFDSVEYADVADDGRLGEWKHGASLNMPRVYLAVGVYGDYVYVMGGESLKGVYTGQKDERPPVLLDTVERARINKDGTLGEWTLEKEKMHFPRRGGEMFVHNGWIYASGGFSGDFLNDVEKARINPDGSIGKWQEAGFINHERYISGYTRKGDNLYVIGGHINGPQRAMDSVETATVSSDATLTQWKETSPLYTRRFLNTALATEDHVYTFGGHNTVNLTSVEKSAINRDGTLGKWEPETSLNIPRRALAAAAVGDRLYVIGGMIKPMGASDSVADVESAQIVAGKKLGTWTASGGEEFNAFKKWKESVPVDAQNHIEHGKAFLGMQSYEIVLYDADEALKEYPNYPEAYNMKADAYFRMGKSSLAEEALKKSIGIKADNFEALVGLGLFSFERGDYKSAADYYKKAVAVNPDAALVRYNLGNAYFNLGDYAAATEQFQWVVKKNPKADMAVHMLKLSQQSQAKAGRK